MASPQRHCLADRSRIPKPLSAHSEPRHNLLTSYCARPPACNDRISPCNYSFDDCSYSPPTSTHLKLSPESHDLLRSQKGSVQIDHRGAARTSRDPLGL